MDGDVEEEVGEGEGSRDENPLGEAQGRTGNAGKGKATEVEGYEDDSTNEEGDAHQILNKGGKQSIGTGPNESQPGAVSLSKTSGDLNREKRLFILLPVVLASPFTH
ncbi:hypothetical protein TRVL_02262 [Trypanosoma vivax]|nr:hypothetical protein TRVL_02262 [Trypanosoma vivax]